jgi:hypothetical protein
LEGPLTAQETFEFAQALDENPSYGFILQEYSVERNELLRGIDEVGWFVQREMDELRNSSDDYKKQELDRIICTVANISLEIVAGVSNIVAERNSVNDTNDLLPPVRPLDLCSMDARLFMASLQQQRRRLRQRLSAEEIERIDDQFRNFRIEVREESGLVRILEKEQARSNLSTFENCWSPIIRREYDDLRNYCGGIASVIPWTGSEELDVSIINWTTDPSSPRLTDFSLEAILHCKQFGTLRKLFEE